MDRRIINPWSWQDEFGFVQAHEVTGGERVLYCSGQTSVDADGNPLHEGDMRTQLEQCLDNLEVVLTKSGLDFSQVVRLNIYTTDVDTFLESGEVFADRVRSAGCNPTSTLLGVQRLAFPALMVEIEATAVA